MYRTACCMKRRLEQGKKMHYAMFTYSMYIVQACCLWLCIGDCGWRGEWPNVRLLKSIPSTWSPPLPQAWHGIDPYRQCIVLHASQCYLVPGFSLCRGVTLCLAKSFSGPKLNDDVKLCFLVYLSFLRPVWHEPFLYRYLFVKNAFTY
jgi:hypothetical protein